MANAHPLWLLEKLTQQALVNPAAAREAARHLLAQFGSLYPDLCERVLSAAAWKRADLDSFDALDVCIEISSKARPIRWRFWLVPSGTTRGEFVSPCPLISPRGLWALARGMTDVLLEDIPARRVSA